MQSDVKYKVKRAGANGTRGPMRGMLKTPRIIKHGKQITFTVGNIGQHY